jgi:hypothetical protein
MKASDREGSSGHADFPTTTIAISLLVGFTFILITEQLLPGAHPRIPVFRPPSTIESDEDAELKELEGSLFVNAPAITRTVSGDGSKVSVSGKDSALILGLVLHALSGGLAMGSTTVAEARSSRVIPSALIVHRGTTTTRICHLLTRTAYSIHCACPNDLFVSKRSKSGGLQEDPRDIQHRYACLCGPRRPFPLVFPVRRWRQQWLGGNCDARFGTLPH